MALAVRILEELAKKGYKVEAKLATETTEAVEGLVAKAKAGKLEIGNVSFKEGTAVNKMTEALLNSMKRADGTLSRSAVLDLHQAYTSAAIKEFGRGPAAEEALETFRKTVSTTWKETRATTPSETRLTVAAAERDARRTRPPGDTAVPVGEPRQTGGEVRNYKPPKPTTAVVEVAPSPRPGAARVEPETVDVPFKEVVEEVKPSPAAAAADPHGHAGHATSEEIAARARALEEDTIRNRNATWGARADASSGLREFEEGGFAAKKAAFDKILKIEGSGWLARPGSAEAAQLEATLKANPRSLDEVRSIILSRPGMDDQGKFVGNLITTDEWTKLRKELRGELTVAEQHEIVNALDVVRRAETEKVKPEAIQATFNRLRALADDPAYQAEIAKRAAARGETLGAAHAGDVRAPKAIQDDLMAGRPVDRNELNRLESYYNRYFSDKPPVATGPGMLSQATSFVTGGRMGGKPGAATVQEVSALDRKVEWETGRAPVRAAGIGFRSATSAFAIAAGVATVGTGGYALYQGQDVFFNPDQPDSTGKKWGIAALTMGPGDWLKSDSGTIKNLYSQAIYQEMQRDSTRIQHWLDKGKGNPNLSPAVAEAIAAINESQSTLATATAARSAADQKANEAAVEAGGVAANRQVVEHATGTYVEKGASAADVEQALTRMYRDDVITADQLDKMATELAKKGDILTKGELGEVASENDRTNAVPATGYQQLERILGAKLTPR